MKKPPIPTTTRQAFKILDELTTPEEKAQFLSQSKHEFVIDQHFGLGMWIRNNWIYGHEKETAEESERRELCIKMLAGNQYYEFISCNPDLITGEFLARYYDHLKRKKN